MKAMYSFNGHIICVDNTPGVVSRSSPEYDEATGYAVYCPTCSLPHVIVQAVLFAVKHQVHKMTVDSAELRKTY